MNNWIVLCLSVGLCWSGAPFLGKASQLGPWIMTGFIAIGTLVPVIPLLFSQNFGDLTSRQITLGLLGGVLNGIGLLAWYRLVAGSNEGLWNLGTVLPVAIVLLSVVLVFGGRLFFQEPVTAQRMIGLALACGAIYFLR